MYDNSAHQFQRSTLSPIFILYSILPHVNIQFSTAIKPGRIMNKRTKINLSRFRIEELDEDNITQAEIHNNPDGSSIYDDSYQDGDELAKQEPAPDEVIEEHIWIPVKEESDEVIVTISDDEVTTEDPDIIAVNDDDDSVKEEDPLKAAYDSYKTMRSNVMQSKVPALIQLQKQIDLMSNKVFHKSTKVFTNQYKHY